MSSRIILCRDGRCIILVDRILNFLIGTRNFSAHFKMLFSSSQQSTTKLTGTYSQEQILYLNVHVYLNDELLHFFGYFHWTCCCSKQNCLLRSREESVLGNKSPIYKMLCTLGYPMGMCGTKSC